MDQTFIEFMRAGKMQEALKFLEAGTLTKQDLTEALKFICAESFEPTDIPFLKILLEKGADPNTFYSSRFSFGKSSKMERPLLYTLLWQQHERNSRELYEICRLFFQHGLDPNLTASEGKGNAFYLACNFLWEDIVKLFLDHGALPDNPADPTPPKETALYEVFTRGDDVDAMARITKLLLSAGAKPDIACGGWERTPLMMAAGDDAKEACRLLLTAGANPNHVDRDGISIHQHAGDRGLAGVVDLLLAYGAAASPYQIESSKLREAVKAGDVHRAAVIGDAIRSRMESSLTEEDSLLIGGAYTGVGRHDDAILLAKKWPELEKSERMISRLIAALAYGSRFEEAIDAWKQYRASISFDSFDPFMIANLLASYNQLGRHREALEELKEWFAKSGTGKDSGLMKFNAACLYSICEDMENSLRMLSLSLKEGKDRESVFSDGDLANLRGEAAFELLMTDDPVNTMALEKSDSRQYVEIVLSRQEVTVRERPRREDLDSCQVTNQEFENRADAILYYLERSDDYIGQGYSTTHPYTVEYWTREFTDNFQSIKEAQDSGDLSSLGVLVVEWDFGDTDGERNIWTGYFSHEDVSNKDETYSSCVYADGLLGDNAFVGPPIDTAEQFEAIVNNIVQTEEYGAIRKETPFYFVYQEHDAGHIHTVKV